MSAKVRKFKDNLKYMRLDQKEFAELIGYTDRQVSNWTTGVIELPDVVFMLSNIVRHLYDYWSWPDIEKIMKGKLEASAESFTD